MHRYTELASFFSTSNLSEVCHFHLRNSELYEQRCVNTNIVRDNNHCPRHSEYLRCCHTCVRINASGAEFSVSLAQGYVKFTMHILVTPKLMVGNIVICLIFGFALELLHSHSLWFCRSDIPHLWNFPSPKSGVNNRRMQRLIAGFTHRVIELKCDTSHLLGATLFHICTHKVATLVKW